MKPNFSKQDDTRINAILSSSAGGELTDRYILLHSSNRSSLCNVAPQLVPTTGADPLCFFFTQTNGTVSQKSNWNRFNHMHHSKKVRLTPNQTNETQPAHNSAKLVGLNPLSLNLPFRFRCLICPWGHSVSSSVGTPPSPLWMYQPSSRSLTGWNQQSKWNEAYRRCESGQRRYEGHFTPMGSTILALSERRYEKGDDDDM